MTTRTQELRLRIDVRPKSITRQAWLGLAIVSHRLHLHGIRQWAIRRVVIITPDIGGDDV